MNLTLGNLDDYTLGVLTTDDGGQSNQTTQPKDSKFNSIVALINKGLDVVTLYKTQSILKQQQQFQSGGQQYSQNPGSSFGSGVDNAVNWVQNNLGLVTILVGGWILLSMNPPSRRR